MYKPNWYWVRKVKDRHEWTVAKFTGTSWQDRDGPIPENIIKEVGAAFVI